MNAIMLAALFNITTVTLDLPPGLLSALCFVESSHKVNAIHKFDGTSHSMGVCQIKLATARLVGFKGTEAELMQPEINIAYAGKYLHRQLVRYKFDTVKAVAAYNSGTYKETPKKTPVNYLYVRKVMLAWESSL